MLKLEILILRSACAQALFAPIQLVAEGIDHMKSCCATHQGVCKGKTDACRMQLDVPLDCCATRSHELPRPPDWLVALRRRWSVPGSSVAEEFARERSVAGSLLGRRREVTKPARTVCEFANRCRLLR